MLSWRHANLLQIWEVNRTKPTRYKWGLRAAWWDVPGWLVFYVPSGTYCFIGHWNVWTTTGHPLVPRVLRHATPLHLQIKWRILIWCFRLSDPDLAVYLTSNLAVTLLNLWSASIYMWTELQSRKQSSWGSSWACSFLFFYLQMIDCQKSETTSCREEMSMMGTYLLMYRWHSLTFLLGRE